jgi:hypothetical protein
MSKTKLDKEEQDILDSFETGEWKSVGKKSMAKYQGIAKETLKEAV